MYREYVGGNAASPSRYYVLQGTQQTLLATVLWYLGGVGVEWNRRNKSIGNCQLAIAIAVAVTVAVVILIYEFTMSAITICFSLQAGLKSNRSIAM